MKVWESSTVQKFSVNTVCTTKIFLGEMRKGLIVEDIYAIFLC